MQQAARAIPADTTCTRYDTQAIAAAFSRILSLTACIDGLLIFLLRPKLLPAAEQAGGQPEQLQPGGIPPPDATSSNATAHIPASLHAVFERGSTS
jgi:hypothetical protein